MTHQPRAGKTLLEVAIIVSIMSIVIGMCATSLATLFRLRFQISRDREQGAALARLATRLRSDAHDAISVTVNGACEFSLSDGRTVSYAIESAKVIREVRRDGDVVHRDRFLLPTTATAAFEKDSGAVPLVRLSIRPGELRTRKTEMPRVATIEAAVGLHRAMAQNVRRP